MLDNSLVIFQNEHAGGQHLLSNVPLMTFGRLGGKVRSGYYMNFNQAPLSGFTHETVARRGYPMEMMLVSILEAMGVTRSELLLEGDGNGFGSWPSSLGTDSSGATSYLTKNLYDLSYFGTTSTGRHNTALLFLQTLKIKAFQCATQEGEVVLS